MIEYLRKLLDDAQNCNVAEYRLRNIDPMIRNKMMYLEPNPEIEGAVERASTLITRYVKARRSGSGVPELHQDAVRALGDLERVWPQRKPNELAKALRIDPQ